MTTPPATRCHVDCGTIIWGTTRTCAQILLLNNPDRVGATELVVVLLSLVTLSLVTSKIELVFCEIER